RKQKDACESYPNGKTKRARKGTRLLLRGERRLSRLCPPLLHHARKRVGVCWSHARDPGLASHWSNISFFRYLAADHQYGNDYRYVPDGVPDPKHPEPRR